MEYFLQLKRLCQVDSRRLVSVMGSIVICVLVLQTFTLPHRFGFTYLFPGSKVLLHKESSIYIDYTEPQLIAASGVPSNRSNVIGLSNVFKVVEASEVSSIGGESRYGTENKGKKIHLENLAAFENDQGPDYITQFAEDGRDEGGSSFEEVSDQDKNLKVIVDVLHNDSTVNTGIEHEQGSSSVDVKSPGLSKKEKPFRRRHGSVISSISMATKNTTFKQLRCNMPPKKVMTISEMNSLLLKRRASRGYMKPQWLTARDKELLSARSQIENAPITRDDKDLYAPLFRNVSMFKKSYELMDRTLKVYVYKEGEKPIFHQSILKGLYASEGWFIKLMEGNKKYTVRDPKRAHLFYMPFSTRLLELSLYVPDSHNRTNLALYLRKYANMLAAKYPFWNRTSGADHFFVACHDWAPYETRHHMESCIKSMCNADVTQGFKISKDVSLPETYVRSQRNTVRDIGGEPPSSRSTLAFFAGSMHGYLRPILLSHWENKDPDMKIFGRMPFGVASKMNYIRHMQTSKYCICAKGYEVNSPRVVEAIFYECVPVIISDNFVPPFFDVLNWDAFSVIVAEKDIPNLKNILLSIPYDKYVALQLAVRKVQRHFIWHSKPVKYDLFSMILHSIWYNRVFTINGR